MVWKHFWLTRLFFFFLGSATLGTFARRLAHEFPTWQVFVWPNALKLFTHTYWLAITNLLDFIQSLQFLLVDLRCHGDSASLKKRGPHSVASTASDVLKLVSFFLRPHVIRLFMKDSFSDTHLSLFCRS